MDCEKKKVEVNRYDALISLIDYLRHNTLPKDVYIVSQNSIEIHYRVYNRIDTNTLVGQRVDGTYEIIHVTDCYAKVKCVIFKDIEDYTMYQPELNFAD